MKFLASSLVFFGVLFALRSHAGVLVVTDGNSIRLVITGREPSPVTSEALALTAQALPAMSLSDFYETLQILRRNQVLDLLGMNRELAQAIVDGVRNRLSHKDCASLEALARTAYVAADVESFQGRNHPGLYFKNYLGLRDLPALVLKQLGSAIEISADESLGVFNSPELVGALAHESQLLTTEQLRLPATRTALRDVFEFAAAKDLFASYRTFRSFVEFYIADESVRRLFKSDVKNSTKVEFESANHERFLALVESFHFDFAVSYLNELVSDESTRVSAFEFAEEVLRTHSIERSAVDEPTLEKYLMSVQRIVQAANARSKKAETTRAEVIEGMQLVTSLQNVAASKVMQFKARQPNAYWRDMFRGAFDMGLVQYTFTSRPAVPERKYSIEPIFRLNDAKLRACELLFAH